MKNYPPCKPRGGRRIRKTDAGGIRALLPGHYLLLKTRKGKRALATAVGWLPKVGDQNPSNAPVAQWQTLRLQRKSARPR